MRFVARICAAAFGLIGLALASAPAAQAVVKVTVDLTTQTMQVRSDQGGSHTWRVSTARSGYVTPRGTYRPQRLARMHYSRKYDLSPMPHSIFFKGGYAIHGTGAVNALGRPASHGCVRLSKANAAQLFAMVQKEGAVISITGTSPASSMMASKSSKVRVARAKSDAGKVAQAPARTKASGTSLSGAYGGYAPLGYAPVAPAAVPLKTWSRNPGAWWLR